jgi:hypothetical protein
MYSKKDLPSMSNCIGDTIQFKVKDSTIFLKIDPDFVMHDFIRGFIEKFSKNKKYTIQIGVKEFDKLSKHYLSTKDYALESFVNSLKLFLSKIKRKGDIFEGNFVFDKDHELLESVIYAVGAGVKISVRDKTIETTEDPEVLVLSNVDVDSFRDVLNTINQYLKLCIIEDTK